MSHTLGFKSTNAELVAAPKSLKAAKEELEDIRKDCREISANAMRLRGLLIGQVLVPRNKT